MFEHKSSFLKILTGDELLVSNPVRILSGFANPFSFLSKYIIPSFNVFDINWGNISFKFDSVTPGLYEGSIDPIKVDFWFFIKSSTLCTGA